MKRIIILLSALLVFLTASVCSAASAPMNDYCIMPPFIAQVVPPLVMFETGRDHKFYFQAYNDAIDLDEDGQVDNRYKHSIQYYGYFDPFKCYTHSGGATGGSGGTDKFTPVSITTDKFCSSGQWSGNVLNWLSMSRMDVLRKVLYGGMRNSTQDALVRSFIPQDAHSWGKELTGRLCYNSTAGTYSYTCSTSSNCNSGETCVDKSVELIGIAASDAPSACASGVTAPTYSTAGKILVAKYQAKDQTNNPRTGICGDFTYSYDAATNQSTERDDIYLSYFNWDTTTDGPLNDSLNLLSYYTVDTFDTALASNLDMFPTKDHGDNFNFFAATEFTVANSDKGDWQFLLDGDDGVELLIDGVVKSIYPGCHPACFQAATTATYPPKDPASFACTTGSTPPTVVTVNLTSGVHRLLVRHRDNTGQDGIRLWFRKTTSNATSWSAFNAANLTLKAPAITAANECSIKTANFISDGTPVTGTAKQHVFCNTSLAANGSPLLRLSKNTPNHMWDWAGRERPVCGANFKVSGSDVAANPIDYTVQVETCKTGLLEDNCKGYPIGSATPSSFQPVGLLQKYGDGDNTKVCSKTMSKVCNTDSDCTLATEGLCIYKTNMYFGMAGTSFTKNMSGGVIRKNFGSMLDEINDNNGTTKTAESISGNIINTFNNMSVVGFDFTGTNTPSYLGNCPFSAGAYGVFTEGTQCKMWGNPIAEMMYESLRYLAGKGTSTDAFDYTTPADSGLSLSHPTWGKFGTGGATYKPYDVFPACARPFLLVLSDINTSYDDDQLPGTSFATYAEDALLPQLNMNVTTLADTISTTEAINTKQFYVGETTSLTDYVCSAKTVSKLSLIRGICPEEPTKRGSFYAAAVAYYGKNGFKTNTLLPEVNTFVIALSSPIADLKFKAGSSYITMVPVGKSVHGGWTSTIHCLDRCTSSYIDKNADGSVNKGLVLAGCSTGAINPTTEAGGAYCPSNQIVNTYVKDIRYDASSNVTYAKFSISYEDVEMGSDFEMDALIDYEICTAASNGMSGTSCTETLAADQIEVKLNSISSAGGVDQAMGFVISGSTSDGLYLPIRDTDSATLKNGITIGSNEIKLPTQWQKTFTTSTSAAAANFLKSPLWYAAKWGGFSDKNGNNKPDLKSEWAANCTESDITKCDPDNYFLVVNPLKLEQQLDRALNDIMRRVSSGTAASILNNSEGSGATLLQAIFYPKRAYENQTELSWSGELMNLWYYVDPFFTLSTIREDSDYSTGNHIMDINVDKRVQFYFDDTESQTRIRRYNFDGSTELADFNPDVSGGLKTMWTAGKLLWKRNIASDARNIYTTTDTRNFIDFSTANAATLSTRMNADGVDATAKTAFATKIIDYVHGTDVCLDAGSPCVNPSRNRTVDIKVNDTTTESHVWKLGDIISSTPKIQGGVPLQSYQLAPPLGYNDSTYKQFYEDAAYKYANRGMVYVGANDGMLHAFKLGKMEVKNLGSQKAILSGTNLGREEWAFVPKHALPYLKYLALPEYDNNHLYLVDGTNSLFDMPTKTVNTRDDYWNEDRTALTWKTVLLGGMGLGGASKPNSATETCTDKTAAGTCVKTPFETTDTFSATHGFSSYFAIDVTNQDFNQDSSNLLRAQPTLLWEFSHPALGYSTSGPAIIRLKPKPAVKDDSKNGRWFAVYASGPTGPIDATTKQFKGKSNQNLKLFVVDIEKGPVVTADPRTNGLWIIDTGIAEAFAGSISNNAVVDAEMNEVTNKNLRQDDVLYVGYTKKASDGTWTDGGVLRLVIPDIADPDIMFANVTDQTTTDAAAWKTSKVIDGIGPVTTTISKLMSKNNMYLFFGTGRYFFPQDDMTTTHRLFMVKEKCYPDIDKDGKFISADITPSCPNIDATHTTAVSTLALSDLTSKTSPSSTAVANGWYIDLDAGERVVTDTVATVNGAVFYTSYKPTADVCGFGGKSYLWGVQYDTGNKLPSAAQKGKVLIQLSTGSFSEMDLSTALTDKDGRRTAETSDLSFGKASADPGLFMTSAGMTPVKRILHIQERYK